MKLKDFTFTTRLHEAIKQEHSTDTVRYLLEAKPKRKYQSVQINKHAIQKQPVDGTYIIYTALHLASQNTAPDITKVLLEYGADPTITDWCKRTPLHWLCDTGTCPDILPLLVCAGCPIDSKDKYEQTPLHIASKRNDKASYIMQAMLLSLGANMDAITNSTLAMVSIFKRIRETIECTVTGDTYDVMESLSEEQIYDAPKVYTQDGSLVLPQIKTQMKWIKLYNLYCSIRRKQ